MHTGLSFSSKWGLYVEHEMQEHTLGKGNVWFELAFILAYNCVLIPAFYFRSFHSLY